MCLLSKISDLTFSDLSPGTKSDDPLSPNYVPTVFAHTKSPEKRKALGSLEKFNLRENMKRKQEEARRHSTDDVEDIEEDLVSISHVSDAMCQTDLSSEDISTLLVECQELRKENIELKEECSSSDLFDQDSYTNDEKVTAITGLPNFMVLMALFNLMKPSLKDTPRLSSFQQLILTLMRLKVNLPINFLSYLVGVHKSTVSRVFTNVLNRLNERLVPVSVVWPTRDNVQISLPMCFRKNFKRCMAIVDCFEIFTEKPKDLKARAQTYSQYKSHNTMKYLMGITPQGVISFISKGWGGRTTDPHITANSGFLDNLLPGDLVLADRGFTIKDQVGLYCARVETPAFSRGKKQLGASSSSYTCGKSDRSGKI